jgi:hypothetical protein
LDSSVNAEQDKLLLSTNQIARILCPLDQLP